MEPRAATASYDAKADQYTLHATTQGAGPMRLQVGAMLGVPPEKVRIVAEEVGGGFGVRFNAYPEYGALCLAAKTLGRPVKWVGSRSEVFVADEQARDIVHKGEIALDANGRMLAMRFEYFSNAGAYLAFTGSFINTVNLVNVASGVYDVPAVLRAGEDRAHQHRADRRLPRRGAPGRLLRPGAPGGRGGARARPRPGRVPPPQLRAEVEVSLQDRHRLRVRLRRFRRGPRQGSRDG